MLGYACKQGAGRQRTFRGLRALEDEYFSRAGGYLTEFKAQCGIPYLSTKLQVILGREIERRLPGVHDQLKVRCASCQCLPAQPLAGSAG